LTPLAEDGERLPDLIWPRHDLSAAVAGGRLYALVGGDDYAQGDLSTASESFPLVPSAAARRPDGLTPRHPADATPLKRRDSYAEELAPSQRERRRA
jgi:hypothetical protein